MGLIGVYSFPKSGNTWLRVIIGYIMQRNANQIPDLHRQMLSEAEEFNGYRFFKHHAGHNLKVLRGQKLDTTNVIHIRRNPLDVFVSYMNHISDNVTGTAPIRFPSVDAIVGTDLFDLYFDTFITTGHVSIEFAHVTGSYFENCKYWTTQSEVPAILLKYEDLLSQPMTALAPLRDLLGIDDTTLSQALEQAAAATRPDGKFFWKQQEKNYVNFLRQDQIDLFVKYRGEECLALGYNFETSQQGA